MTGPTGPSGSGASGDPNTQAYFGPSGALTDDVDATMTLVDWQLKTSPAGPNVVHIDRVKRSMAIGDTTTATGNDSFATGNASVASGNSSQAEGLSSNASAEAAHAEGRQTTASAPNSHAEGFFTTASGADSHAEGSQTTASNDNAHAEGLFSIASAQSAHAEGVFATASAQASHAEGTGTQATNTNAHAEGNSSTASGFAAHSEGNNTVASGASAHAQGDSTTATGDFSTAAGLGSLALRDTQEAYASGIFAANGDAQISDLVERGSTPGMGAGESVELGFGSAGTMRFVPEDDHGYTIVLTVIAKGAISGVPVVRSFRQTIVVRRAAGVSVIAGAGVQELLGDVAAVTWTFAATVGVAPDRIVLTFTTGATTSATRVVCDVAFVEVLRP